MEEKYSTSNVLRDVLCTDEGRDEARLCRVDAAWVLEVVLEALKQCANDLIAIIETHKQIIGLRKEIVCAIRHENYLCLF